jgi:hypothetical protein
MPTSNPIPYRLYQLILYTLLHSITMPRLRKYQTEAEVKAANVAKTQRYRQRKKLRDQQPLPAPPDVAMSTSTALGIRAPELDIPAG